MNIGEYGKLRQLFHTVEIAFLGAKVRLDSSREEAIQNKELFKTLKKQALQLEAKVRSLSTRTRGLLQESPASIELQIQLQFGETRKLEKDVEAFKKAVNDLLDGEGRGGMGRTIAGSGSGPSAERLPIPTPPPITRVPGNVMAIP